MNKHVLIFFVIKNTGLSYVIVTEPVDRRIYKLLMLQAGDKESLCLENSQPCQVTKRSMLSLIIPSNDTLSE